MIFVVGGRAGRVRRVLEIAFSRTCWNLLAKRGANRDGKSAVTDEPNKLNEQLPAGQLAAEAAPLPADDAAATAMTPAAPSKRRLRNRQPPAVEEPAVREASRSRPPVAEAGRRRRQRSRQRNRQPKPTAGAGEPEERSRSRTRWIGTSSRCRATARSRSAKGCCGAWRSPGWTITSATSSCPTEKVTEFKGGKKRVIKRKLYPGYLVVHMEINDDTWFLVRETPGIGDFTGAAGRPTPDAAARSRPDRRQAGREEREGAEAEDRLPRRATG